MERKNKIRFKAILVAIMIIMANYIQITYLIIAQLEIVDFRCDAEYLGNQRYKADANQIITFTYDAHSYSSLALFLGDGTYLDYIEDSTVFHNYTTEGIYNVTLWVFGSGGTFYDNEWLILEIDNDAPEFDIGYTSGEFHDATYHFEDEFLAEPPQGWIPYNNEEDFFLSDDTNVFPGDIINGGVENLTTEDQISWDIQSEWAGGNYRYIEAFLKFEETQYHVLSPGQYQLFFSANVSMSLLGYNPSLGENEILFNGNYSNGELITITSPKYLKLFANYYIENWASKETIKIDWFKLKKVYKGVEVVNDHYGYGKVVQLELGTPSHYCGIMQSYSPQKYGTIEFWYSTKNSILGGTISFAHSDLKVTQKDNKMFIGTKEISPLDSPIMNNTWYHLRIDFNIEGPVYQGLYSREGRIFLDGLPSDFSVPGSVSSFNYLTFESNGTAYIDAIGYTWDEEYYVGKNVEKSVPEHLYEDLEITFSVINMEESELDKIGFSYERETEIGQNYQYIWDFGDGNYSYEESPTYKFSNTGEYPVRVTLIDDQGAMNTEVKNFLIKNKEPETDILYGLNYDATYDFKYDVSKHPPSDWVTHGSVQVVDFKDEYSKVVEIDTTAGGYGMIRIPEPSLDLNGSIEFWIYFTDIENDDFFFWVDKLDPNDENLYVLKNSTRFGFLNGKWMYYYTYKGAGNVDKYAYGEMIELPSPVNNEWTHIRFDYCWSDLIEYNGLSDKQWRTYVNGVSSNIYQAVGKQFNRKGFDIRAGSKIYLESIGFTTDSNYDLGDNNPERLETYYGTWDFRFYPNGPIPFDDTLQSTILGPWVFGSYNFEKIADNCSANILNELDGHQKVLELQDNNANDLVFASLIDLAEPTLGTIEFWLRTTDTSQGLVIALGYEIFHSGIWLGEDGKWWYKNEAQYLEIVDVPKMLNNTWHHIRIDFNCTSNQFYFGVDGNYSRLGPFNFDYDVDNFGWNIWSTVHEGYNYSIFLDAIGGSWDPAYEIGDNLNAREAVYSDTEIIFSADSKDTQTDKENLRYLWNFGDNQTGYGQTVLHSFSRAGKYKVKVIAIDDNAEFEIAEKYIWIDNVYPSVDITEVTYGKTSYNFIYDNIGDFPNNWYMSDLEELLGVSTQVVNNVDIFSNVVLIGNGTGVGGIWTSDVNGLPFNQTEPGELSLFNGTIEFWMYTTDVLKSQFYISFFQDSYLDGIFIEFVNGSWTHNGVEIEFGTLWTMQSNTWTHFRIDFSCDSNSYMALGDDEFIIYADGHASQNLNMIYNKHLDISNLTCFGVFTQMYHNESTKVYVDNFGFSWDPEYQVGDNEFKYIQYQFNEGETIILDCMSYDTYTDYQRLIYNWGDLYMNVGEWNDLGWHYSYTFMDNDDGDQLEGYPIISFVGDPLYMWDLDSYHIEVNNVLPSLNIHSANVVSNISLSINNINDNAANFTIYLQSPDSIQNLFKIEIPTNYGTGWINFNWTIVEMLASKEWDLIVNQTGREGGEHQVELIFRYENSYEFLEENNFDGGSALWVIDVDDQWTDSVDQLSNVPLSFVGTITDPSDDKINLEIDYKVKIVHEVDSSNPLTEKNFTIPHEPYDIIWRYEIIEENARKYAINTFITAIPDDWSTKLMSGNFPVAYDFTFDVDFTNIDFYGVINDLFSTEAVSVIALESTVYSIEASYNEFQPSSIPELFNLEYSISDNYNFEEVGPAIKINAPINISEDQPFLYLADVNDMNSDNVSVNFSFGINDGTGLSYQEALDLGNNIYGINYTYSNEGKYLINIIATDGKNQSKFIQLIDVVNQAPYAKIKTYQNVTSEDEYIEFKADLYDTASDINSLRYFWDFGDGVYSAEENPFHAYYQAGEYKVRLNVRDNNGASYTAFYNITVIDEPPEIYGPFTFPGAEGQTIILDVDISDSISDFEMNYTWDIYKAIKIYNSTFNFMNLNQGDIPGAPFEFTAVTDVQYRIIDEMAGHRKVLELCDNNDLLNGSWSLKFGDSSSVNGSIEFWLRSTHISIDEDNFAINLLQYGTVMMPIYVSDNGTWIYKNGFTENQSIIPNVPKLTSNTWHHIRIDYECSNGHYTGLGEDQWRIIIDGISSPILDLQFGSFPNNDASYLDCLQIISGNPNKMSIYCDAIGFYDQTTEYNLGDNVLQVFEKYEYIKTIYGKKPSVAFDAGSYLITLKVENEKLTQTDIKLEVQAVAPILTVPNKRYYGHTGNIDITAYARDSIIDSSSLEFEWLVKGKRMLIDSGTLSSTISIFCNATGLIKGRVTVRDHTDLTASSDFSVKVYMDSNGNGDTNEWEMLHNETSIDKDGDGLPNFYERRTVGTNASLWDTDDDLLSDGYSNDILSGELAIGTDPLDNDTDDDNLLDGFEWFGWNHTLSIRGSLNVVKYYSNPLKIDSDGDLLNDYEEFTFKTNPLKPDTDNDMLTDTFELFEYGSNPYIADTDGDGLIDGLEYEIGTHYNVTDTDKDGISDGVEYNGWGFVTNPLTKDTDQDFLSDSSETLIVEFEIDGMKSVDRPVVLDFKQSNVDSAESALLSFMLTYSESTPEDRLANFRVQIFQQGSQLILYNNIFNIHEDERYFTENLDIKDIIESSGKSYSGKYILKVAYGKYPHGDLALESFRIAVNRYLDPNDEDFDDDGILDGVETQLIVEGIKIKEFLDSAPITADTNLTTYDTIELEIDDVGFINDADIYFTIESNHTLLGNGGVAVKVIQQQLNYHIEDTEIFSLNLTFSTNDNFVKNYHIEPLGFSPYNYYGKCIIIFDIYSTNYLDGFNILNVRTEIDGYRDATSSDTRAWITKPDLEDSDDDGWSDYYEVNRGEQTNPLAWDTDGDGVKDSIDIDPLYDIILEIKLKEGHVGDLPVWYVLIENRPNLQMTASYTYNGKYVAYCSKHEGASKDTERAGFTALSDYMGTSIFDRYHYLNVDDDLDYMTFTVKLWDEGLGGTDVLWDTFKTSKTYTYYLRTKARNEATNIEGGSGGNWVKYAITKRGLSRANTIAVYSNETLFNGHFNEDDSVHIFQINITQLIGDNLPFVGGKMSGGKVEPGINYLIIPNSVFVNTVLASIIQDEDKFANSFFVNEEFVGLDRDNIPETATNNIESLFLITCSYAQALQILNWSMWGIINDTTKELGKINLYSSSNIAAHNCRAEMMNLHPDVLGAIVIIQSYKDSSRGSMPLAVGEWWASVVKSIIHFFVVILTFIELLFRFIIKAVAAVIIIFVMAIIKTALLIYIWTMFGLSMLIAIATINLIGLLFLEFILYYNYSQRSIMSIKGEQFTPLDVDLEWRLNYVHVDWMGQWALTSEVIAGEEYNSFLNGNIPTIESYMQVEIYDWDLDITLRYQFNFYGINLNVEGFDLADKMWDGTTDNVSQVLSIMGATMSYCGSAFTIIAAVLAVLTAESAVGSLLTSIPLFMLGLLLFYGLTISPAEDADQLFEIHMGMALGLFLSGILIFDPKGFLSKIGSKVTKGGTKWLKVLIQVTGYLLAGVGFAYGIFDPNYNTYLKAALSIGSGVASLVVSGVTLALIKNDKVRKFFQIASGIITLCFGLYFLVLALTEEKE